MKFLPSLLLTIWIIMVPSCVRSFHRFVGSTRNTLAFGIGSIPTRSARESVIYSAFQQRFHTQTLCWRLQSTIASEETEGSKKRVVFLGTPEVAATSLQTLYDESLKDDCLFEIVSVITQPPKRRRRKGKLEPSPVGKVAEDLGLPVLSPEKVRWIFAEKLETISCCF